MSYLNKSAYDAAGRSVGEAGKSPTQWTDNVVRVYAVIKRHPEITFEYPRITGKREFTARWPIDPDDPDSEIRSAQTLDLGQLASRLEKEFPVIDPE